MEVKIQIPDNCELIKDGDTYIVREKKQIPPRTWKEFCSMNRVKSGEAWIEPHSVISCYDKDDIRDRKQGSDRNLCTSKEEAEAFLALMQLRQLRKAWVGDWDYSTATTYAIIKTQDKKPAAHRGNWVFNCNLSFPTKEMADDFLECFKDLCETAKMLL